MNDLKVGQIYEYIDDNILSIYSNIPNYDLIDDNDYEYIGDLYQNEPFILLDTVEVPNKNILFRDRYPFDLYAKVLTANCVGWILIINIEDFRLVEKT